MYEELPNQVKAAGQVCNYNRSMLELDNHQQQRWRTENVTKPTIDTFSKTITRSENLFVQKNDAEVKPTAL